MTINNTYLLYKHKEELINLSKNILISLGNTKINSYDK